MCTSPLFRILDERFESARNFHLGLSQVVGKDTRDYLYRRGFVESDFQRIPCGRCIECRLAYSKEWALRCVLESKLYPENYSWFVTLTYDDFHLPKPISILNTEISRITPFFPLVRKDIQLFLKRLRKQFSGLRVYYCGEYGEKNLRPHFHLLLFNAPLFKLHTNSDFSRSGISEGQNFELFESKEINDCWKDSQGKLKGLCAVARFSYATAGYTARYVMKKMYGNSWEEFNEKFVCFDEDTGEVIDFPREFVGMSNRPGIGANYFPKIEELVKITDNITTYYNDRLNTDKVPRYFDKLLERQGVEMEAIKLRRANKAENQLKNLLYYSNISEEQYIQDKKDKFERKLRELPRNL